MKTKIVLLAAACACLALASCKDKKVDVLAERNQTAIEEGAVLPFIRSFEEADFCATAQAMLPGEAMKDSLAYLIGVQCGYEANYRFGGVDVARFDKGAEDFAKVDYTAFMDAAQTNFEGADELVSNFEISPAELETVAPRAMAPEATEGVRDSMSYLYGVLIGVRNYTLNFSQANQARFHKSFVQFPEIDANKEFETFSRNNFRDSLGTIYASRFEINPGEFQALYRRFNQAKQDAMIENIKIQSRLFIDEAAKVSGIERKSVEYKEMVDTVETIKSADILYHYTELAEQDGPYVALGDSLTVVYTGRHINYEVFDQGSFPVNGLAEQGLIRGFTEALQLLREGDQLEVVIPYQLGYGERGQQNWWTGTYSIYPEETLVFTISVKDVRKPVSDTVVIDLDGEESSLDVE